MNLPDSFLFRNLPVIKHNDEFIIYDYFGKRIAKVTQKDFETDNLPQLSFFGVPQSKLPSSTKATLTLILNRDCNMGCEYCFAQGGQFKETIKESYIKAAIDQVVNGQTQELLLTFFGGEPTMCPDKIAYAVEEAEKKRIPTIFAISTNGVMPKKTLDYLISKNFAFNLSMDGPPNIQNAQRPMIDGRPSSSYVEKTIDRLVESGSSFKVRATITNKSVRSMPKIVEYLASKGVKYVHLEAVNISGRAEEKRIMRPDPYEFVEQFKNACGVAKQSGVSILNGIYTNLISPSIHSCSATTGGKLIITPEGNVSRCYEVQDKRHPYSEKFIVGKYNESARTFDLDIAKAVKLCDRSAETSQKCNECFAKYICSGGCVIRNLHGLHTSDISKVDDYQCTIIRGLLGDAIVRMWEASSQEESK